MGGGTGARATAVGIEEGRRLRAALGIGSASTAAATTSVGAGADVACKGRGHKSLPLPPPPPPPLRVIIELGCGGGPSGLGLAAAVAAWSAAGRGNDGHGGSGGGGSGGGWGKGLRMAAAVRGVEVVLTDRDPTAVQLARANIASNRRLLQAAGYPPKSCFPSSPLIASPVTAGTSGASHWTPAARSARPSQSEAAGAAALAAGTSAVIVKAAELDWDDVDGVRALLAGVGRGDEGGGGGGRGGGARDEGGGGRIAVILAADVVYHEDAFASLVAVLVELTKPTAATTAGVSAAGAVTAAGPSVSAAAAAGAGAVATTAVDESAKVVPLVYLAYRQRCEAGTAAHFFHMLDVHFTRERVPWMWPSTGGGRDAALYRLAPRRGTVPSSSVSPCGYCDMLRGARARRLASVK